MVPVGGNRREYADMSRSFTCCHGSGLETHAIHAGGVYYEMGNKLWVNLYTPSTVDWQSQGVKLDIATDFPLGETVTMKLSLSEPKELTLALRKPYWAGEGFVAKINGQIVAQPEQETGRDARAGRAGQGRGPRGSAIQRPPVSSYVELTRTWRDGDTIELTLPKTLRTEPTPDDPNRVAIMWGPLVLAPQADGMVPEGVARSARGRRGGGRRGRRVQLGMPVLLAEAESISDWLRPISGRSGEFLASGLGRQLATPDLPTDLTFVPFYASHQQSSYAYVDLLDEAQWASRATTVTTELRQLRLEAATVGYADAGEMQAERDFNYQSSEDRAVESLGVRHGRGGAGWFSFDMPVEADNPMALLVTLNSERQDGASFEVHVDGTRVATQSVVSSSSGGFYDAEITLPANLVAGKEKITVRFQATGTGRIPTVFGVRTIRADAER
jgi:hypothetical protein